MTSDKDQSRQGTDRTPGHGGDQDAWVRRRQGVAELMKLGFTREEARELFDGLVHTEREMGVSPSNGTGDGNPPAGGPSGNG